MTNEIAVFRTAVIGSLLLAWIAVAVDFIPGMVSPKLLAAAEAELQPGELFPVVVPSLLVGVAAIVATFGLAAFASWSRPLAVAATIASLALYPFVPAMPQSGWASMLFYLSAFAWGVGLAMAFFSPLAARFAKGV